ncbi:MAG TPA: WcbI family polysaccharide biosynthesis putative acetyltransferase [Propionibacteriaceae bacterium]|nr:WcbI family polysaccharide biosynthesis putative acetyltransferase [Propionibacteriaceae bacterium]
MARVDGRTRHYEDFYGVAEPSRDSRALLVVWGNCQAEALRILLSSVDDLPFRTVRVPAVHELTATDVPHVRRLAQATSILLTQPIRTGYNDMPLGTDDVVGMLPAGGRVIRWPVVRYGGLEPFSAIVRDPVDPGADPPVVPYHDLRTLTLAAGARPDWDVDLPATTVREVSELNLAELRRREEAGTDVAASDLIERSGADAMHTIDHPGNPVLSALAERMLDALDAPGQVPERERPLLGTTLAPREPRVLAALGLPVERARPHWEHAGTEIAPETVREAQLEHYAEHPDLVQAGLDRYAELIDLLGLR